MARVFVFDNASIIEKKMVHSLDEAKEEVVRLLNKGDRVEISELNSRSSGNPNSVRYSFDWETSDWVHMP